jgi:hypothetical protein
MPGLRLLWRRNWRQALGLRVVLLEADIRLIPLKIMSN